MTLTTLKRIVLVILTVLVIWVVFKAIDAAVDLPDHYIIPLFISLGLWTWALNVHGLTVAGIDVPNILKYEKITTNKIVDEKQFLYKRFYRLAILYTLTSSPILISPESFEFWTVLFVYLGLIGLTWFPFSILYFEERQRFLRSMYRIVFEGLSSKVPFGDVVLADILTSFSQVLGDLNVLYVVLINSNSSSTSNPIDKYTSMKIRQFLSFCFISMPYLFRLRQCIAEYRLSQDHDARLKHFYNALKYSSAIPVVASGSFIKYFISSSDANTQLLKDQMAATMKSAVFVWFLFATINATYCLYWDIFVDWDLGYTNQRTTEYNYLRPTIHYENSHYYYAAILFDIFCRTAWIYKLYLFNQLIDTKEIEEHASITICLASLGVVFKFLEIFRRAVWVFFRVEREWVHTKLWNRVNNMNHAAGTGTRTKLELGSLPSTASNSSRSSRDYDN